MEGRHSLSLLGGEPLGPGELEQRGVRMRRLRDAHASVSSFGGFGPGQGNEDGRSTRAPSWTLEALRENLFGLASHRRGQDSVASSSVGSQAQSTRSSLYPPPSTPGVSAGLGAGLGVGLGSLGVGPPSLASPRDANFQFAVGQGSAALNFAAMLPQPPQLITEPLAGGPVMRKVVRPFAPLLPDELVLRPGEELAVLQEFDDGWCVVAREGIGIGGPPTPPGLDVDENGAEIESSGKGRVLEMGSCPSFVFEDAPPPASLREYTRPMRSSSLGVTVSMKLPGHSSSGSASGASGRGSPLASPLYPPLPLSPQTGDVSPLKPWVTPSPGGSTREEVISWSNF